MEGSHKNSKRKGIGDNLDSTVSYMNILIDSLQKKCEVLQELDRLTREQSGLLDGDDRIDEEFDRIYARKDVLLQKLEKQDDGFENMYSKVGEILKNNHQMYRVQIEQAQKLIRIITDLSVGIQAEEAKNKEKMKAYLQRQRREIGQIRRNESMAGQYHQNGLNRHQAGQSYFLDQKK